MIHLYNETEVAKLSMYISDAYLDSDIVDTKAVNSVLKNLNRRINSLKKSLSQSFLFEKKESKAYEEKKYTRYEALLLVFLTISNTHKHTFYSNAFLAQSKITYEEARKFYYDFRLFLSDKRFAKDGEWYNYEQSFCKKIDNQQLADLFEEDTETIEELSNEEISYLTKNFADYVQLLKQIEQYEALIINAHIENSNKVITKNDFSHFPIFSVDNEMIINSGMLVNYTYAEATKLLELINNNIVNAIIKANEEAQSSLAVLKNEKAEKAKSEIFLIID